MATNQFIFEGSEYWSITKFMAATGMSRYLVEQAIISGRLKTIRLGTRKFIEVDPALVGVCIGDEIKKPQTI